MSDDPSDLKTTLNALVERLDSDVAANDRVETICNRMMSRVNEFFEGVEEL
jgi:hypothetical protein